MILLDWQSNLVFCIGAALRLCGGARWNRTKTSNEAVTLNVCRAALIVGAQCFTWQRLLTHDIDEHLDLLTHHHAEQGEPLLEYTSFEASRPTYVSHTSYQSNKAVRKCSCDKEARGAEGSKTRSIQVDVAPWPLAAGPRETMVSDSRNTIVYVQRRV